MRRQIFSRSKSLRQKRLEQQGGFLPILGAIASAVLPSLVEGGINLFKGLFNKPQPQQGQGINLREDRISKPIYSTMPIPLPRM